MDKENKRGLHIAIWIITNEIKRKNRKQKDQKKASTLLTAGKMCENYKVTAQI